MKPRAIITVIESDSAIDLKALNGKRGRAFFAHRWMNVRQVKTFVAQQTKGKKR